jgi:hypothetical protein
MSGKRGGCAAFGCVVVVLVGLAAVAGLWSILPELAPPPVERAGGEDEEREAIPPSPVQPPSPPAREESPVEEAVEEPPPSVDPDLLRLSFRFTDHAGRSRRVACTVRRADHEREMASFGVAKERLWEEVNAELQDALDAEARARGVAHLFTLEVEGKAAYRWRFRTPPDRDLARRAEAFHAWLNSDAHVLAEQLAARAYHEYGFRFDRGLVSVDYQRIIHDATGAVADCYRALRRAGDRAAEDRLASLFLAFFQELRYEIPPEIDARGRETLGFRVPTGVLVEKAGDCDSKAAAFCAVWRQLPARSLVVMVPEHALVAVEGRPGPDQTYVRLGNRYYILCEVAGPGKAPPGVTTVSGNFEYLLIEPAGG